MEPCPAQPTRQPAPKLGALEIISSRSRELLFALGLVFLVSLFPPLLFLRVSAVIVASNRFLPSFNFHFVIPDLLLVASSRNNCVFAKLGTVASRSRRRSARCKSL